jgi:hypothetical protein
MPDQIPRRGFIAGSAATVGLVTVGGFAIALSGCEYPGPNNTGVPAGILPVPQEGSITTTEHGQVISTIALTGSITVAHDNVQIRNCLIRSAGTAIRINGNTGLVVEDCELDGTGATTGESIIGDHNYVIRRCNIHHIGEGPRSNGNVTVEACWMHDFSDFIAQGAHQDGIQITSGDHHRIVGNSIDIGLPDGSNAAIFAGTYGGDDLVIENNLLAGGGYTVGVHDYTNIRVVNNRFAIAHDPNAAGLPSSGWWGPLNLERSTGEVSGNVWHDGPNEGQAI